MSAELNKALTMLARMAVLTILVVAVYAGARVYTSLKPQPAALPAPTLSVAGTGEAYGIPDIATITFSVLKQGDTVTAVTESGNTAMQDIITVLKDAGIADADIRTTAYRLSPRYDYSKATKGDIIGYDLNQSVTVKIRNLESTATVTDAVTVAGANNIGTPIFEIDDPDSVKSEARAEAFTKAQAKAQSLANAAGMKLGSMVTFSESGNDGEKYSDYNQSISFDAVSAETSTPTFSAGSDEINVTVNVTYALK
ncbi:MAG: hypothetical protein ACD_43C00183G0005 [uncultured bacterium]|nr:MAG: hypothetical protein ACD_43C00183G0005 [uncultured bacterium]